MRIGILALQGAFAEHSAILQKLGADSFEIRQKRDLAQPMDGLIIPGGESTVMGKLLKELDCYDEVRSRIENGLPVFGTCAGLILLAKEAEAERYSWEPWTSWPGATPTADSWAAFPPPQR